jgi:hypothetical protein
VLPHPCVSVSVLAWPVNVGIAERDAGQPVLEAFEVQLAFPCKLRSPVGRDGVLRVLFWGRELSLFAVDIPPIEAKMNFCKSYFVQFSMKQMVPRMLTFASKSGLRTERRMFIWASWCDSTSGLRSSNTSEQPVRMCAS